MILLSVRVLLCRDIVLHAPIIAHRFEKADRDATAEDADHAARVTVDPNARPPTSRRCQGGSSVGSSGDRYRSSSRLVDDGSRSKNLPYDTFLGKVRVRCQK